VVLDHRSTHTVGARYLLTTRVTATPLGAYYAQSMPAGSTRPKCPRTPVPRPAHRQLRLPC